MRAAAPGGALRAERRGTLPRPSPRPSPSGERHGARHRSRSPACCRHRGAHRPGPTVSRRPQPSHLRGGLEDRGGVELHARESELGDRPFAEDAQDAGGGERPEPVTGAPVHARAGRACRHPSCRTAGAPARPARPARRRRRPAPAVLGEIRHAPAVRQLEPEAEKAVRQLLRAPSGPVCCSWKIRFDSRGRRPPTWATTWSWTPVEWTSACDNATTPRCERASTRRERNGDAELAARRSEPRRLHVLDRRLGLRLRRVDSEQVAEAHAPSLGHLRRAARSRAALAAGAPAGARRRARSSAASASCRHSRSGETRRTPATLLRLTR